MLELVRSIFGPLQVFLRPGTVMLLLMFVYLTVFRKDKPAGLVLCLGLVVIADSWMGIGIPLPGQEVGTIRYSELVLVLLMMRELGGKGGVRGEKNPLRSIILKLMVVYLIFFFISVVRSGFFMHHFFRNYRDLGIALLAVLYISGTGFESKSDYRRFLYYLIFLGIIITIGSFQEFLFDRIFLKSVQYEKTYHAQAHGRFGSFFGNPNMLAAFYVMIIPLVLTLFLEERKTFCKIGLMGVALLFLFGLYKTFTRAAFVSIPISMSCILLLKTRYFRFPKKIVIFAVIVAAISIFSPKLFSGAYNRLMTIRDEERMNASRLTIWKGTEVIVMTHLMLGSGFGEHNYKDDAYNAYYRGLINEETAHAMIVAEMPHNSYIYILTFMGIFALIVMLLIKATFFLRMLKVILKRTNYRMQNYIIGFYSAVLGFCLIIIFDYQLFVKSTSLIYWSIFGVALSLYRDKPGPKSGILSSDSPENGRRQPGDPFVFEG